MKVLKTVEETFNIFNDGRKFNPAPQKFMLSALTSVLNSPMTKERIALNEAIGYYGHRFRELTGKIRPTEVEMIEQNGKMVAVNIVPAVRTRSVSVDGRGNVTHKQEFLDTESGRAALSTYDSGSGGFSWALSGSDGHNTEGGSVANSFSGFDLVHQPNFIPLHRQSQLLSSLRQVGNEGNEMLLSSMIEQGVNAENAAAMLNSFQAGGEESGLDSIILSNLIEEKLNREQLLSSVIEKSPFLINEKQRGALLNCKTADDVAVLNHLFSAMQNTNTSHLPNDIAGRVKVPSDSSGDVAFHDFSNKGKMIFS